MDELNCWDSLSVLAQHSLVNKDQLENPKHFRAFIFMWLLGNQD